MDATLPQAISWLQRCAQLCTFPVTQSLRVSFLEDGAVPAPGKWWRLYQNAGALARLCQLKKEEAGLGAIHVQDIGQPLTNAS